MTPTFAQYLKAITKGTIVGSSFPSVAKWFVVRQAVSFPALTLQIRPLKPKKKQSKRSLRFCKNSHRTGNISKNSAAEGCKERLKSPSKTLYLH